MAFEDIVFIFYVVGMILSLPFLFSTFLVYALIRDLRNLHGKSLMCHVATLIVYYTSQITVQLVIYFGHFNNEKLCIFFAYIIQFSALACFVWLNIMCFDIWWTFRRIRPLRENKQEYEAKKFIIYSIYAWGSTALMTIFTFGMDANILEEYLPPNVIRPGFGTKSNCWFISNSATMLYFYGPISILLLSNLLMFIHSAIIIVKHMRCARVLNGSESQNNVDHEKQLFLPYMKLFTVMGLNYLLSWAIDMYIIAWSKDPFYDGLLWCIQDIGNLLQAVFIFLIFICNKRVLILLSKKLCPRFQLFKTSTASTIITNNTTPGTSSNTKNNDAVEMSTTALPNSRKTSTNNQLNVFKV